jgi:uncharacterized membrane protein
MEFIVFSLIGSLALGVIVLAMLYIADKEVRSYINIGLFNITAAIILIAFFLSFIYYLGKFIFPLIMSLSGVKFQL